jgi:hypothetical protein
MSRAWITVFAFALISMSGRSAPTTKDRTDGPITDEQLAKSAERLKRIVLAMHEYHDASESGLPANQLSKDKKPLLSWRVQILPYLGEKGLCEQFKLDEPWDSVHNKKLVDKIPAVFAPVRGTAGKGQTFYQVFTGEHAPFGPGKQPTIPADFPDGTHNTFLVAEGAKPVTWTEPADLEFDGETVPALGGMFDGRFHAAFADGTVKRFRKDTPTAALKLLIDPADGFVLPEDYGLDVDEKKK